MLIKNLAPYHLLVYSLVFGSNVFHSYINAPLLFKNLSKEDFSHITNLILPKYFAFQTVASVGLILTTPRQTKLSYAFLGATIFALGVNMVFLGPKCRKLKQQRAELEKQPDAKDSKQVKELTKQFGKYHGLSLLCNVISTVGLTGYGFSLTKGLALL